MKENIVDGTGGHVRGSKTYNFIKSMEHWKTQHGAWKIHQTKDERERTVEMYVNKKVEQWFCTYAKVLEMKIGGRK